jgi:hypothetical protein
MSLLTDRAQQHLDEVMDSFDFTKVASAMLALNWQWCGKDSAYYVPDEHQLRKRVREMARCAIQDALTSTGHAPNKGFYGTGGFHIEAEAKEGELDFLYVRFTLTEWCTDPLDGDS